MSSTSSSHHQQLRQPSSHPLRMGLASALERKVYSGRLTSSLLLPHLLSNLLLLTLHLRAGHVVGFLLYSECGQHGVSRTVAGFTKRETQKKLT